VLSKGTFWCVGTETLKVSVRILGVQVICVPLIVFKLYLFDLNIHTVNCIQVLYISVSCPFFIL